MEITNISNHCQTILQLTDDGNNLSASDLQLVENAINGYLTTGGEVVLYQLRYKCENNTYEKPPFCGVDNLTRGNGDDRSVFWKGIHIEHYDHDFWQEKGWQENMRKDAQHLGQVCRYLEDNCIAVNFENYLKYSKVIIQMTAEESAFKKFQDEPFFEVLIESIARSATKYAYAQLVQKSNLGAGNIVDCIIKEQVTQTIKRLERIE